MRRFRKLMFHPVRPHTRAGRFVISLVFAAFAALLLVLWAPAHADDSQAPAAESPYFFVDSAEHGVDRLPLKATRVDVRIAGMIADVTVTQHFLNEGQRQQARIEFDLAKKEGKTGTLLEQHRPNVFQMSAANILPGDVVAVELRYTELLRPREAVYGFVFPTVVGPRCSAARRARGQPSP